jgi:hypothetical protein
LEQVVSGFWFVTGDLVEEQEKGERSYLSGEGAI